MTDRTLKFQKDIFRNDSLIGYKALIVNTLKKSFHNAAVQGPCIVK